MPFDKKGGHHLNTQKAMAADKAPKKEAAPPMGAAPPDALNPDAGMMDEPEIVTCPQCGATFDAKEAMAMPPQGAGEDMGSAPMPEHAQMTGM